LFAGKVADPERMGFRKIRVELAHLRHRHAEHFGELDRLGGGLRLVDFVADDHQRHLGFDQKLRGALHLVGVRTNAHARIDLHLIDDLGAHTFVVVVGVP
jgi:hypothetical protein